MLLARSSDLGLTWTHWRFPWVGCKPDLLEMSNGVLAAAFGRPGNFLAFSLDGGKTWPRRVELAPYGQNTSGYVGIEEVAPGRLLAVYDQREVPLSKFTLWGDPEMVVAITGQFVDVTY